MEDKIQNFIDSETFAVAGSFRNTSKYAYLIFSMLKTRGKKVYPVNPSCKEVDGEKCYPSILNIPGEVEAFSIVTPPSVTEKIVAEAKEKGIRKVWMQPGAESPEAVKFCRGNNISVIYNTCLLVTV